jgi:hypothetical protein
LSKANNLTNLPKKGLQPVTPRLPAIDLRALLLIEFQTSMTLDG